MRRWAVEAVMWLLLAAGLGLLAHQALAAAVGRSELVGAGGWMVAQWVAYQVDRWKAPPGPGRGESGSGGTTPPSSPSPG